MERRGAGRWRRATRRGGAATGRECPRGLSGPDTLGPLGYEWNRLREPHACCGRPVWASAAASGRRLWSWVGLQLAAYASVSQSSLRSTTDWRAVWREIRMHGSEGGEARQLAFPTPIEGPRDRPRGAGALAVRRSRPKHARKPHRRRDERLYCLFHYQSGFWACKNPPWVYNDGLPCVVFAYRPLDRGSDGAGSVFIGLRVLAAERDVCVR